ncbi:MAG: hypothetical protein ACI8Z1_002669 [Candidatus Azotimanducaceae bacterium]|jgi:hypothetical protein
MSKPIFVPSVMAYFRPPEKETLCSMTGAEMLDMNAAFVDERYNEILDFVCPVLME